MPDAPDDLGIPMKPARPSGQSATVSPVPRVASAVPPRTPELARPLPEPIRQADPPRRAPGPAPAPEPVAPQQRGRGNDADLRRLIVGREISLSGEITSCDKLVVEGSVEANLQNCHEIEIAESGLFKGSASIDDAEVRGRFEGELVVRRRLLIRAGGRVTGTIRYGQLEVEAGGVLSGDIQAEGDNVAELTGARAAY
ncbi:MAG TPA: polymer-forming cytoskeletal protein [Stellaceae bacterium]|nr:polymer-forming cytoskeletal protein [Stellaceae bacterium]